MHKIIKVFTCATTKEPPPCVTSSSSEDDLQLEPINNLIVNAHSVDNKNNNSR